MSLREKARATAAPKKPEVTNIPMALAQDAEIITPADSYQQQPTLRRTDNPHSREEAFLALFEIFKEIAYATDETALFRGIATGLMAHLAVPSLALFFRHKDRFVLRHSRGYKLAEKTAFPLGKLPSLLLRQPALHYIHQIKEQLEAEESLYLSALEKSIIVPAVHNGELAAFAIVALPERSDFSQDDLLFLQLFGETLAAFRGLIDRLISLAEQERAYHRREVRQSFFNEFTYRLATTTTDKDADLLLSETLNEKFGLRMYVLVLKEDYFFRVHCAQGLRRKSLSGFEMALNDPIMQELQQARGWQIHDNFRDDRRFTDRLDEEDITLADGLEILPLHHNGQLKGCFMLFALEKLLAGDERFYLQGILQSWLFRKMTDALPRRQATDSDSPYLPLKRRIAKAEEKLAVYGVPYTGILLQIVNLDRLEGIFGPEYAQTLRHKAVEIIRQHLSDGDYCLELLHGQFFLLAEGAQSAQAFKITRQMQRDISEIHPREELSPLVRSKFFSRPEDELPELEKFLQI